MVLGWLLGFVVTHVRPKLTWSASAADIYLETSATRMCALANVTEPLGHIMLHVVVDVHDICVMLLDEISGLWLPLCHGPTDERLDAQCLRAK